MRPAESKSEEYISVRHPDYWAIETQWLVDQWAAARAPIAAARWKEQLDEIKANLANRVNDAAAVLQAIDCLGLYALRPSQWAEGLPAPDDGDIFWTIRRLVWRRISEWYEEARFGATMEQRRTAARALSRLGDRFVGERRGHRRAAAHDHDVWTYYQRTLLRLRRALRLLKVWPWSKAREEKVRMVSTACGISPEALRQHLGLDSEWLKRPVTCEEQARILTANYFGITQQTVENKVSAAPKSGRTRLGLLLPTEKGSSRRARERREAKPRTTR